MKKLNSIAILLTMTACNLFHPKWIESNPTIGQPKRSEYHLSKQSFQKTSLIDTASVYVSTGRWFINGDSKERTLYDFLRFSNEGTIFLSAPYDRIPDVNDFNIMTAGQYCLYSVDRETIKVEWYNPLLKRFDYWYGQITEDQINFYKYEGRAWGNGKGTLSQKDFKKIHVNLSSSVIFPN